jgi:ferrous-iron efflux pump FieF
MQNKERLLRLVTFASLAVAFILFSSKFVAWFITDSVAILSSLMDSTMDLMVSAINFFAMRYALKPADHDHRFGHGKAEDLAALTQAVFILGLASTIAIEAIRRFSNPVEIHQTSLGVAVMVLSMVLTVALVFFQKYVHKHTNSHLVRADAMHYLTDILSNAAVLVSLLIAQYFDVPYIDPIMALIISVYIIHGAWEIGKPAFDKLMDKEFPDDERQKILDIIKSHSKVVEVTDLRTRHAGQKAFIQFSFTMDGAASLNEAHDTAHQIELCILGLYPDAEISMHQEPA